MPKQKLQKLANSVVRNLVGRGSLGEGSIPGDVEESDTGGWCCTVHTFQKGAIQLWFDPYMNRGRKEFYYGYFSAVAGEVKFIRSLFDNASNVKEVTDADSEQGSDGFFASGKKSPNRFTINTFMRSIGGGFLLRQIYLDKDRSRIVRRSYFFLRDDIAKQSTSNFH